MDTVIIIIIRIICKFNEKCSKKSSKIIHKAATYKITGFGSKSPKVKRPIANIRLNRCRNIQDIKIKSFSSL